MPPLPEDENPPPELPPNRFTPVLLGDALAFPGMEMEKVCPSFRV